MEWLFPIDVSPEGDLPIFDPSEESVDSLFAGIIPFMSSITPWILLFLGDFFDLWFLGLNIDGCFLFLLNRFLLDRDHISLIDLEFE